MLRATLLQATHHFDAAQRDLVEVIRRERGNVQAWLTQATVQVVRADYAAARASCARLAALAPPIVAATCAANVGSMTGQLAGSRALLETVFAREGGRDPDVDAWVRTLLADMAERAGDAAGARRWYEAALKEDANDTYLAGAYADFLLDHDGADEVLKLLARRQNVDGLLLRYAIALRQLGRSAELAAVSAELDARFAAAMQRGDGVHQREQAMYELRLKGNGARALALAQQNWAVQKESADARVLLEAAAATGERAAAAPVLNWMRAGRIEDLRLTRLARTWGALQ
ncbi:MAG: tetratricopeptide repeat protein [Gammaproteobacteria bacterium]